MPVLKFNILKINIAVNKISHKKKNITQGKRATKRSCLFLSLISSRGAKPYRKSPAKLKTPCQIVSFPALNHCMLLFLLACKIISKPIFSFLFFPFFFYLKQYLLVVTKNIFLLYLKVGHLPYKKLFYYLLQW